MKKLENYLLIIFILALFIRLVFIFHPGFLADIAYWKWWSSVAAEKGLIYTINNINYNYPSFYLYILKITGHIYLLFSATNNPDFWNTFNSLFLFLIKIPYVIADLGVAFLIYLTLKDFTNKRYLSLLGSCLFLFNPAIIYNSAIWGQTDSLGTFFALLALFLAMKEKLILSSIIFALAFFLKVHTNFFILLGFLYIFLRFGLSKSIKSIAATTLAGLFLNFPYLISSTFDKVVAVVLESFNYFPFISLNAYNLPWFLSPSGRPDKILDTTLLMGNLNYKNFGLILFAGALIIAFLNLIKERLTFLKSNPKGQDFVHNLNLSLIESCTLAVFSFYMLPTQMHERYLIPIFAFLPILLIYFLESWVQKIVFITLMVSSVLNLHMVMLLNYPETSPLPFLPNNYSETLTNVLAFINIVIYILFLISILKKFNKKLTSALLGSVTTIILFLAFFPNLAKEQKNMVYISNLTPAKSVQGYGSLGLNKSVAGQRLSTSYYFYEKGLGTHANSEITYELGNKFKYLTTDYGIDTETQDNASVEFIILADDKEVFKSGKMGKWDGPRSIKINLENVNKLTLKVTDAGDGINNDHADWLNPKLFK